MRSQRPAYSSKLLQKLRAFLAGHMRVSNAWTLPRSSAMVLCLLCFFLGRFTQVQHPLHKAAKEDAVPRKLVEDAHHNLKLTKPTQIGPSELSHLVEQLGLLQAKPPVTPGSTGNPSYTIAPFQVLSWEPRLYLYPALVDEARCEHIVNLARSKMLPSEVAPALSDPAAAEEALNKQESKTTSGSFLSADEDPDGVLAWLEERIATITQLPVQNGEAFNVLRYGKAQYYESHMDAFEVEGSQRIAAVLTVLSAPEEGGETVFKREGRGGGERNVADWQHCLGADFKYKPRQGDALVLWATTPDGKVDKQALHGACPVKRGEKWVITKWIRDTPIRS